MSLLKDKPLKKCHTDKRKMIDDIHSEMISNLSEKELNEYYLENGFLLDQYYRSDKTNTNNDTKEGILSYFENKNKGAISVSVGLAFLAFGEFLGWYSFMFPESMLYSISMVIKIAGLIALSIPVSKVPLTKIKFDKDFE